MPNLSPSAFENIANLHFNQLKSVIPKSTQRKLKELTTSKIVETCENYIKNIFKEFLSGDNVEATNKKIEKIKEENQLLKRKSKIEAPDFFKYIFGNHQNERIFLTIKSITIENQSGALFLDLSDSDMDSISDEEESKSIPIQEKVSSLVN